MRLYLIRHGETDWNRLNQLQGKRDIPLNAQGEEVARKTRKGLMDVPFTLGITSPLKRAARTAELLLEGREIPIRKENRIEEIGFGEYEGMVYTKTYSEIPDEKFSYFFTKPEAYRPGKGGESVEELLARERDFWQELLRNPEYEEQTILISTHGAALGGLLCVIKGQSEAHLWDSKLHKNCGFSVVDVVDGEATVLQEGVTLY